MMIDLSSEERLIIIQALKFPPFKDLVQEPQTPRRVRDIYRKVVQKIGMDEILHRQIARSIMNPETELKRVGLKRRG